MKATKFYRDGNNVHVFQLDSDTASDTLKPAVYSLRFQEMMGYYLADHSPTFDVPSKVFGPVQKRCEKVLKTYEDRSKSTGVLLTGDKGSGKTMLALKICNEMIGKGLPIILIDERFSGSSFNSFLNMLGECVLFFEELEKLEAARKELYEFLDDKLNDYQMLDLVNITGQMWKVSNRRWPLQEMSND